MQLLARKDRPDQMVGGLMERDTEIRMALANLRERSLSLRTKDGAPQTINDLHAAQLAYIDFMLDLLNVMELHSDVRTLREAVQEQVADQLTYWGAL